MRSSLIFAAAFMAAACPRTVRASSCDENSENCANVQHAKNTVVLDKSNTLSRISGEQHEAAAASSNALSFSRPHSYHPQAADKPMPHTDPMRNATAPRALQGCVAPTSLGTRSCPSSAFACNSVDSTVYESVVYHSHGFVPTGSPPSDSGVYALFLWRHKTTGFLYLPLPRRARNRAFGDWTSDTIGSTSNIASQLGSTAHGCASYWALTFFRAVRIDPGVQGSSPAQIITDDLTFAETCYPRDGPGLGQAVDWCNGRSYGGGKYGSAGACNGDSGTRGAATVDFSDTPFSLALSFASVHTSRTEGMASFSGGLSTFQSQGLTTATLTNDNRLLVLRSGGWCGEVYADRSALPLREVAIPWQATTPSSSSTATTRSPTPTPIRSAGAGTAFPSSSSSTLPSQAAASASPSSTRLPSEGPPLGTVLSLSAPVSGSGMSRGEYRLYTFTIPSQVFTITLENIVPDADLYVFTNREAAQAYQLGSGGYSPTLSSVNGGSDFVTITPGDRWFRAGASAYIAVYAYAFAPSFWLRVDLGSDAHWGNELSPSPTTSASSTPFSSPSSTRLPSQGPPLGTVLSLSAPVSHSGMSRGENRLYTFTIPSQVFTITFEVILADAYMFVFLTKEAAQTRANYRVDSQAHAGMLNGINSVTRTPGEGGFRPGADAYIVVYAYLSEPSFWLRVDLGSSPRYGNGRAQASWPSQSSVYRPPVAPGDIVGIIFALCVGLVGLHAAYKRKKERGGWTRICDARPSASGSPHSGAAGSGSEDTPAQGADAFTGLNPMVRNPAGMYAGMPAPIAMPAGLPMPPPGGPSMYPPAWNPALMPTMSPGGGMQMGGPQGHPPGVMYPPLGVGSPTPQPVPGSMPTPSPFMYTMGVLPPPPMQGYYPQEEANERARADSNAREDRPCAVCLDNEKDTAFGCGHLVCHACAKQLTSCHICRQRIEHRIRLYG